MNYVMKYNPVDIARMFVYVRESGMNLGRRVESVQHWALGAFGDSWCDEFAVGFVLDICFQGESPFPRQVDTNASTIATLAFARKQGWTRNTPIVGCLVLSVNSAGVPHHIAICTQVQPLKTIAGNTSEDGLSSNGDRVGEHEVSEHDKVYVIYPGLETL